MGDRLKTLFISDTAALGLLEERPEPAWRVRMQVLRNKELLAPDYGAMHVAAYLKSRGWPFQVANIVADVHGSAELFAEVSDRPDELSGARIASPEAAAASRSYMLEMLTSEPDVIFVSLSTYGLALYCRRLLGEVRASCPAAKIVAGGIYSTFHTDEILSDGHADAVVRGEGELTAEELLGRLASGRSLEGVRGLSYREGERVFHNPDRAPVADLDTLPHPYTVTDEFNVRTRFEVLSELIPGGDWIPGAGFLTSRGCPEACTFCLDPAINHGRTRFHSPAYVRDVLGFCAENFTGGAGSFFFGDATFTMNKKRLAKILELLGGLPYTYHIQTRADYLDRATIDALASKGFTDVALGAETFNEEILRRVVHKRLDVSDVLDAALAIKGAGMKPMLTFIVGLPGETRASILNTVEVLRENGIHTATFFPLVVFKGTQLFEEFASGVSREDMERVRLNPMSEEFLFVSPEFPDRDALTGLADEVNALVAAP